jgi:hypothetical protein
VTAGSQPSNTYPALYATGVGIRVPYVYLPSETTLPSETNLILYLFLA